MPETAVAGGTPDRRDLPALRQELLQLVLDRGHQRSDVPLTLASGEISYDFIDGKAACANGRHLELACRTILGMVEKHAVTFDAVGGLTLGADHFSHGVALLSGADWFTVRKEPKGRGTNRLVEGHALSPGDRVLLVDDVVTTGGSIQTAYDAIRSFDVDVVLATTLVDRGDVARDFFASKQVLYEPVFTHHDLEIEPVGHGSRASASFG